MELNFWVYSVVLCFLGQLPFGCDSHPAVLHFTYIKNDMLELYEYPGLVK